jgi:hypothetical protein
MRFGPIGDGSDRLVTDQNPLVKRSTPFSRRIGERSAALFGVLNVRGTAEADRHRRTADGAQHEDPENLFQIWSLNLFRYPLGRGRRQVDL